MANVDNDWDMGPLPDDPRSLSAKLTVKLKQLANKLLRPTVDRLAVRQAALAFAATVTWVPNTQGTNVRLGTMTGVCTLTIDPRDLPTGAVLTLQVTQDGTGGRVLTLAAYAGYTINWGATGFVANGIVANKSTFYTFIFDGTAIHGAQFTKDS